MAWTLTGNIEGPAGPQGPQGTAGPQFVSPTQPIVTDGQPYLWVQTGLGPDGKDFTFWVEDGT